MSLGRGGWHVKSVKGVSPSNVYDYDLLTYNQNCYKIPNCINEDVSGIFCCLLLLFFQRLPILSDVHSELPRLELPSRHPASSVAALHHALVNFGRSLRVPGPVFAFADIWVSDFLIYFLYALENSMWFRIVLPPREYTASLVLSGGRVDPRATRLYSRKSQVRP